jgi:hypothetical protein
MSKYYLKGTPKSSIRQVVLRTSVVLFTEHRSGGSPPVRPPPEDQCLAFIL